MKRLIITGLVLGCTTGCGAVGSYRIMGPPDHGVALISGPPEFVAAINDGQIGLVTEAKSNPDLKGPYWQNREKETTIRGLILQRKAKEGQR